MKKLAPGTHRDGVHGVVDLEDVRHEQAGGQDRQAAHDAAQRGRPGLEGCAAAGDDHHSREGPVAGRVQVLTCTHAQGWGEWERGFRALAFRV